MDEVIARLAGLCKIARPVDADDISRYNSRLTPGSSGLAAFLADNPNGFIQLQEPDLRPLDQWVTEADVNMICIHPTEQGALDLAQRVTDRFTSDPFDPTFRLARREVLTDTLGTGVRLAFTTLYPLEVPIWQ